MMDLVMYVVSAGLSGHSDQPDDLPAFHPFPAFDQHLGEVAVTRDVPVLMVDVHVPAETRVHAGP